MSDDNYMGRGLSQVLFNYLPGATFDYSGPHGVHRAVKVDAVENTSVDRDYIAEQVLSRVRQWRDSNDSMGAAGFPSTADQYSLLEPTQVRSEVFPLLFYCGDCYRVQTYDSTDELAKFNRSLTCQCGGDLQQHRYVFMHECGEITTPRPGQCQCSSWDDWVLDTQDSQRFENFRWRCKACGNTKDIRDYCDCNLSDPGMQLAVHSGSSVYVPHYFTVIDISDRDSGRASSPIYTKKILASYLNLTDQPVSEIDLDTAGDEDVESLRDTVKNLEKMYEQSGSESIKETIKETKNQIEELEGSSDPLAEEVEDYIPFSSGNDSKPSQISQEYIDLVYDLQQYLDTSQGLERRTVRDVILEAGGDNPAARRRRESRAERVEEELRYSVIDNVRFIENFPITTAVFGYTRGSRDENEAMLQSFTQNDVKTSADGFPIFVNTVETEAIQFELDQGAILEWLLENSRVDASPCPTLRNQILESTLPGGHTIPVPESWTSEEVSDWLGDYDVATESLASWDESAVRAWFINNMGNIPEYDSINIEDEPDQIITYFVYNLVHTYSHIVIKQMTDLSGVSRTSMAEHLLPYSSSFIIYINQQQDFSLGGIYTLIESSMDELITQIFEQGDRCVYDPVCSRRGSTCFSCMHISEVSCSHLNRNLGRDFMFGSKPASDRDLIGFADIASNRVER